jgi:outer membrane immunogenic protein
MTKLLLIGVTAAAMTVVGSANAADMALKAPPIVPIVYPWTGCYVGGNAGLGVGTKVFQDVPGGFIIDPVSGVGSVTDGIFGGIGGGQVGCDYQVSPNFVIGVQGNFDAADISGSVNDPLYTGLHTLQLNAKTDSLFGAVGRVGYTPGSGLLWYVDGGAAWAHDVYSPVGGATDVAAVTYTSASETRFGGVVGAGFEMFVTPNIAVFAEYDHYFFGTKSLPFTCTNGGCGSVTQFVNITQDINTFRVGANWRFVWWPH